MQTIAERRASKMPYKNEDFRKAYDRKRHKDNPRGKKKDRDVSRKRRLETKIKVLSHYGVNHAPQCCWPGCNVNDVDVLCIDHVNDDGAEQRRRLGVKGNIWYEYLVREKYPEGYQTLCANHNLKKEILRRRIV